MKINLPWFCIILLCTFSPLFDGFSQNFVLENTYQLNVSNGTSSGLSDWVDINMKQINRSRTFSNVKNTVGSGSNIDILVFNGQSQSIVGGVADNKNNLNNGPFPNPIYRFAAWTKNKVKIWFEDLDPNKKYSITVLGGRSTSSNTITDYIINGVIKSINSQYNNSQTQTFDLISPDGNNEIFMEFQPSSGSTYGYLNLIVIEEFIEEETDTDPPALPTGLSITGTGVNTLDLDWDDNTETDLASYNVYRGLSSGFTPEESNQVGTGLTESEFSDSGLAASTLYYYLVTAVDNSGNESPASTEVNGMTEEDIDVTPPAIPVGLSIVGTGLTTLDLDWDDNIEPDFASYNVYRGLTSGFTPEIGNKIATGLVASEFNDTGLTSSTVYYYLVSAVDNLGNESGTTAELIGTTDDIPDTTPPALPTGLTITGTGVNTLDLDWDDNTETDLASYNVYRGLSSGFTPEVSNQVATGLTTSEYNDSGLASSTTYYYLVSAVDNSGNESATTAEANGVTNDEAVCSASGSVFLETWSNVGGTEVSQIPLNTSPTSTSFLNIFEIPVNSANDYGTRVRGFICPPTSGSYKFWIAGDDNCELWLSTDDNLENKLLIANVSGWTNSREWGKFSSQESSPIPLVAGQKYYIEALHKEGGGGDNLAVGWELPNGTLERPINGDRLSPYVPSPEANAGENVVLFFPDNSIQLDGSQSYTFDTDGLPNSYSWIKVSGPSLTISDPNTSNPTLTDLAEGDYIIELTITDDLGNSGTDQVSIKIRPEPIQTALDPNDPMIDYDPNNPPSSPPYSTVSKWVRTKRVNWDSDSYKAYIFKGMPFRLKFPENFDPYRDEKYPLIIMLHGLGERGTIYDNEWSMKHGGELHRNAIDNGTFDGFMLYPQSTNGFWNSTYFAKINELVSQYLVDINVDLDRVVMHGLSSGGQGVWKFASEYPKLLAGALPMSAASPNFHGGISQYKYMPIWMSSGGQDNAPSPFTAQQQADAIISAGGNLLYTLYPDLGHGVWNTHYNEPDFFPFINRAHKTNPLVFYRRTEFCPGDPIEVRLGFTPGFEAYEWRKDGVIISGANSNEVVVNELGIYDGRFKRNGEWSNWSKDPVVIKLKDPTLTPPIQIVGLKSNVIPAPDGSSGVTLEMPEGYVEYTWKKVGSNTVLGSNRTYTATQPGEYIVSVKEEFGCSSNFSEPFNVIDNDAPNGPENVEGVTATTLSRTSIRLDWENPANPTFNENSFEIYRSMSPGGPYQLIYLTPQDASSYLDENLDAATSYYYILRAINENAGSDASVEVSTTTFSDETPPSVPSSLEITGTTRNGISLNWGASTDDVELSGYEVYVNGVKAAITSNTYISIQNLEEFGVYSFFVKAKDATGNESARSNEVTGAAINSGLIYSYYEVDLESNNAEDLEVLQPNKTGTVSSFTLSPKDRNDQFGFVFEGSLNITTTGNYTFYTTSDDGSVLYIGSQMVVDNDGAHGAIEKSGSLHLSVGSYPIKVLFFERGGGELLEVKWEGPGISKQPISEDVLKDDFVIPEPPVYSDPKAYSVFINLNTGEENAPAPWNNTGGDPFVGNVYPDLKDADSKNTGVTMSVIDNAQGTTFGAAGYKGSVTGNNSGVYPDVVMKYYWWIEQIELATLRFDNLNLNYTYDFRFFASREAGNRGAEFTINGSTASLNASYNTTRTVTLNNVVPDNNGGVNLDIKSRPGDVLGYIGAIEINAIPIASPSARIARKSTELIPTEINKNPEVNDLSNLIAYPNPFNTEINLDFGGVLSENVSVFLFDITGKLIKKRDFKASNGVRSISLEINKNEIGRGIYILKLMTETIGNKTLKLIKK